MTIGLGTMAGGFVCRFLLVAGETHPPQLMATYASVRATSRRCTIPWVWLLSAG